MSKYIIDTETWANLFEVQRVGVYGIGNDIVTDEKTVWSRMFSLDELEELNSDYINEHYGSLQDEAYQKGFEDGKNSSDMGCEGCRYTSKKSHEEPCFSCTRNHTDQYTPMPKEDDRIEVGDEVEHSIQGIGVITRIKESSGNTHYNAVWSDGNTGYYRFDDLKKTGKHYDIQSILEAMKS